MPHLGPFELVIILVIVILIFGVGKLSTIGGSLGKAVKDFKEASKEVDEASKDLKEVSEEIKKGS